MTIRKIVSLFILLALTSPAYANDFDQPIEVTLVRTHDKPSNGTTPTQHFTFHNWQEIWHLATGNNRLLRRFGSDLKPGALGTYNFAKRPLSRTNAETFCRLQVALRYRLSATFGRDDYRPEVLAAALMHFRQEHVSDLADFQDLEEDSKPTSHKPKTPANPSSEEPGFVLNQLSMLYITLATLASVAMIFGMRLLEADREVTKSRKTIWQLRHDAETMLAENQRLNAKVADVYQQMHSVLEHLRMAKKENARLEHELRRLRLERDGSLDQTNHGALAEIKELVRGLQNQLDEFQPLLDLVRPLSSEQRQALGTVAQSVTSGQINSRESLKLLRRFDRTIVIGLPCVQPHKRRQFRSDQSRTVKLSTVMGRQLSWIA